MHVRSFEARRISFKSVRTPLGVSKKNARAVLNEATELYESEVVAGKPVPIGKIVGSFVSSPEERKGRSPATGQEITIPAGNVPKIFLGCGIKKALSES